MNPDCGTAGMEKSVIVVGVDESEISYHALEWTLRHLFPPAIQNSPFKLVIVHAKPSAVTTAGLAGPGVADAMPYVDRDLKRTATRVLEKAKEMCSAHSVSDVILEGEEGDPRNILCEAVEKHHASMLVVGSHGHGAIKRAVLGGVSDYCAHHAHCTVTIVKKPSKTKH